MDLSGLPVYPVGHPQYERTLEFRMKVEVANTINERKREQLVKLREQFEADKARIAKMKSERKFRPY